ncbi:MAG: carboxypeptidase regulatory-like domain-containing protein [Acidobacteriaceae bacterium]
MTAPRKFVAITMWLVLCSGCAPLVQAQATPRAAALYPIAGTLTDSVTGDPIFGATVTLLTERPRAAIQTTITDSQGHFALKHVPAGKYALIAQRRGYLAAAFDQHEEYSSAIVTGEGQDAAHIPFHLDPEAQMEGTITDDAGDPVDGATVVLLRRTNAGGFGDRLIHMRPTQTDDTGQFELWNLYPGDYYVAVTASPWYALHPTALDETNVASDQQRASVVALDVAYPITWYDGTADEQAAATIHLAPGDTGEANVTLHAVPALHLMVHLPGESANQRLFADLQRSLMGQAGLAPNIHSREGPPGSGTVEFTGVAPGHYTVSWGEPAHLADIDSADSQEIDLAAGTATANTKLQFKMADGSPLPKDLRIFMAEATAHNHFFTGTTDEKGVAQFVSVPPGRWIIDATTADNVVYGVTAIQAGGKVKTDDIFDITGQQAAATVLLVQGKTRIDGFAFQNGKGKPGTMILLVPKNSDAHMPNLRRDQADSDGSFSLPSVVPGDYTVVAIQDGWGLEFFDAKVIARYLARGTPVTVTDKSGPALQLAAPVEVQPR